MVYKTRLSRPRIDDNDETVSLAFATSMNIMLCLTCFVYSRVRNTLSFLSLSNMTVVADWTSSNSEG